MRAVLVALFVLAACGDDIRGNISVSVPDAWRPAVAELVSLTPYAGLSIGEDGDFRIEVVDDDTIPAEGYRIDPPSVPVSGSTGSLTWRVHAHDVLGAQYGVSVALENMGFLFRHPFDPLVPFAPKAGPTLDNNVHQPQIAVRALHLHTLHPIEAYFAFIEPSPGSTNDAHRIIDWIIKNKGNYVQWAELDDIQRDPARYEKWKPFVQEILAYAHMRGVRVGVSFQLFGMSNLQNGFDLRDLENDDEPLHDAVAGRLSLLTKDLPFDSYDLTYGEFFNSQPQDFIDATNEVVATLRELAPAAEAHTLIHVGATQRVQYMGRDLLYYFLVQYADPTIIPDIHTVMYFNLYDPTVGAYQHTDFSEHRQYLLDRVCAGKKTGYHPETGYWVAFDNSLPMYMPLYVYSRWRDLDGIKKDGCGNALYEHLIFSTGWEWGYWLHDVAALRSSYELPDSYGALVKEAFGTDLGPDAADLVVELAEEQKDALITHGLSGYLAGRDIAIDLGRALNPPIISQPDRISFDQLVTMMVDMMPVDIAAFEANVMAPLKAHAGRLDEIAGKMRDLDLPDTRWGRELRDGIEIDVDRTWFVVHNYEAVLAHIHGDDAAAQAAYDLAADDMASAKTTIARRHKDLHDTHGSRITARTSNYTFYQYGYLNNADTQCFWRREYAQVGAILGNTTETPPGCLY
ncbi:MAG TPA: hypothetical protein VMZ53_06860 [Kofleriaceae bacterium]|nr:hypothetical protein [Kofleriaceae bacterium]